MNNNIRLLLVCPDYFPHIGTGDKNFWFKLVPLLYDRLDYIAVASLNYHPDNMSFQDCIPIYNIKPFRISRNHELKCGMHFSYLDRTITFPRLLKELNNIITENNINTVHFTDNFGPVQCSIRKYLPMVQLTASATSYHSRYTLYDRFLKLSLFRFDKIIAYSDSMREKLLGFGIPNDKLITIRWGVVTLADRTCSTGIRERLNIRPDTLVMLWTGYTQQTNYNDFIITLNIAKNIVKTFDFCHFIFAFKPENYKPEYQLYAQERIDIITNVDMKEIFSVTDVLIAPVSVKKAIIAPPLTWLEAMSYGIPVVTTNVGGANEVIINGINGFISLEENLESTIMKCLNKDNIIKLSENARQMIKQRFDIENIASNYFDLWNGLVNE